MASLPYKWPTVSRLYQASVPGGEPGWLGGVAGRGGRAAVVPGGGGCSGRRAGEWFRTQPSCPGDLSGTLNHTPAHDTGWLASFVKFTWNLPLLIIKHLTSDLGAGEHNLVPPGPAMCLGVA